MLQRVLAFIILLTSLTAHTQDYYLLVGTYDSPKSEGIYVYRFSSSDGSIQPVSHIKTSNPSYLSIAPGGQFVYAVHENAKDGKGGEVAAFSFNNKTGELQFINQQGTGGDHPCYVETDHTGKWVFAGNYTSGSLSVLPVLANGAVGAFTTHIVHEGSGPSDRQKSPHVHCTLISPDNQTLLVPDLGIDKVMLYKFDAVTGTLKPENNPLQAPSLAVAPGISPFIPINALVTWCRN